MKNLMERCEVSIINALKVFDNKITKSFDNIETAKEKSRIKRLKEDKLKIEQETLTEYREYCEIRTKIDAAREKHKQFLNSRDFDQKEYLSNVDNMFDKREIRLKHSLRSKYFNYDVVLTKLFFHSLEKRNEFDINPKIKHDDFRERIVNKEVEEILYHFYQEWKKI